MLTFGIFRCLFLPKGDVTHVTQGNKTKMKKPLRVKKSDFINHY